MPEFNLVDHPTLSPTRCLLCHQFEGQMLDTKVEEFTVPSAVGAVDIEAHFYICVGTPERPGCLPQMGRLIGMVDGWLHDRVVKELQDAEESEARLANLLAEREAEQHRVVSVDEILRYMQPGTATSTAGASGTISSTATAPKRRGRPKKTDDGQAST